jgi:hypothetical protein
MPRYVARGTIVPGTRYAAPGTRHPTAAAYRTGDNPPSTSQPRMPPS